MNQLVSTGTRSVTAVSSQESNPHVSQLLLSAMELTVKAPLRSTFELKPPELESAVKFGKMYVHGIL
jgi:hypothetical protein